LKVLGAVQIEEVALGGRNGVQYALSAVLQFLYGALLVEFFM
jgi:hypothetical protein